MAHHGRGLLPEDPRHHGSGRHVRRSGAAAGRVPGAAIAAIETPGATAPRTALIRAEDLALAAILGIMMLLPIVEIVLRRFGTGISNQTAIVQHCTLLVGMLGAAIAARERQLLTLGIADLLIKGRWRAMARVYSGIAATAVTAELCLASLRFALSERGTGSVLAFGFPVWIVQLALPLGFALIALRIARHASGTWPGRLAIFGTGVAVVLFVAAGPFTPAQLAVPLLVLLGLAAVLGAPIFAIMGGVAIVLFFKDGSPIASLTLDHYGLVTNPTLPTVPLFTLAGYFLAEGGASRRLIRLFQALVGRVRGGPAILVALVCAFFTSFTGASGVTILALGGLLMPVLLSAGYSQRNSLGLLTGTGSLGLLFPPCLPLIFYGVIAGVDITDMFLGGILPGLLLVALTVVYGVSQAPRNAPSAARYDWRELRIAAWEARWELLVPVVAFGALFGGFATPVEAAAFTAFYAFVVETFLYRDLHPWRDAPRVMAEAGILVGGVLLILGVALGFTNYLAFAEVPAKAVDWVTASVHSKWTFLLLLNLFLLIVGALMDIYSAIIIVVPLIVPLGVAFGISPVHLGIVFLTNMELGYLTPPVGANLFLASLRFNQPVSVVFRAVLPMLLLFGIGLLLVTYVPALTTTLPGIFGH